MTVSINGYLIFACVRYQCLFIQCFPYMHSAAARRRCWIFSAAAAAAKKKKYNRCQSMPLIGGPLRGPPINGMDQAVLDQEGDMNTFNNRIYRITAHNFI